MADCIMKIAQMMVKRQFGGHPKLVLFLEVKRGRDLRPITLPKMRTWRDVKLLFFKLYDPKKRSYGTESFLDFNMLGLIVSPTDKPSEILTRLNRLAGYDPDEEIELYE
ncbi:ubiquitin carboxyl-terminal hydrolase 12-like protein, partial [Trifolium pratense]